MLQGLAYLLLKHSVLTSKIFQCKELAGLAKKLFIHFLTYFSKNFDRRNWLESKIFVYLSIQVKTEKGTKQHKHSTTKKKSVARIGGLTKKNQLLYFRVYLSTQAKIENGIKRHNLSEMCFSIFFLIFRLRRERKTAQSTKRFRHNPNQHNKKFAGKKMCFSIFSPIFLLKSKRKTVQSGTNIAQTNTLFFNLANWRN